MIPKPEILKGNVLEFIDLVNNWIGDNQSLLGKTTVDDFYGLCFGVSDFYRQKFIPEMITEYFEGINYDPDTESYRQGKIAIEVSEEIITITIFGVNGFPPCYRNKFPKTLSQFTTNLIQANIKLIWKELK